MHALVLVFSTPPPGYIDTAALTGCSNKSGEAIAGDMQHWCSYNMTRLKEVYPDYGEYPLFDQQIVQATVKHLHAVAATKKPFFIACGLHRPHLPFAVPSEFHDILPPTEDIRPPKYNRPPEGSPYAAWHPGGFGKPVCTYNVSVPQEQTKAYRKAYYAAVSFMDVRSTQCAVCSLVPPWCSVLCSHHLAQRSRSCKRMYANERREEPLR
eukprot:m.918540 g.918540  ORF g.918540 m.918540 type:complete len:210 (-) comp23744_c3_seq12:1264-1893(-)